VNQSPAQTSLLRVRADDPAYQAIAASEAEFWQTARSFERDRDQTDGPVDRHVNARFTGDPARRWEDRIADLGPFRRGLVLGASEVESEEYILATNPTLHLTFVDLSEGTLERRRATLGARFPGRVTSQLGDLNFIELPPDAHDLVISSGVLHHVLNIEWVAWQVNRTLTAGGRFVLQDYVGETRLRFSAEKRRLYEVIHAREFVRAGRRPPTLLWKDESNLSPLCGVRSTDTLSTLRHFLIEEDCRFASALTVANLRTCPGDDGDPPAPPALWRRIRHRLWPRRPKRQEWLSQEFVDELELVGDVALEAGLIEPGIAFAVYRKRV